VSRVFLAVFVVVLWLFCIKIFIGKNIALRFCFLLEALGYFGYYFLKFCHFCFNSG